MEHVHALAVTVGGVTPPLLSSLATVETCSAIATRLARLSLVVPTLVDAEQSGQANVCVLSQVASILEAPWRNSRKTLACSSAALLLNESTSKETKADHTSDSAEETNVVSLTWQPRTSIPKRC